MRFVDWVLAFTLGNLLGNGMVHFTLAWDQERKEKAHKKGKKA